MEAIHEIFMKSLNKFLVVSFVINLITLGYYRKANLDFWNLNCAEINFRTAGDITQRGYVNN